MIQLFREVRRQLRARAKDRSRCCTLTDAEIDALVQRPCDYCGDPGSNTITVRRKSGCYRMRWNGVDRVLNAFGYLPSNVVPCCKSCNRAKGPDPREEYILRCYRVVLKDLEKQRIVGMGATRESLPVDASKLSVCG